MFDSLRVIFAGTSDFAACHLYTLIREKYQIVGVFTQPDRPAGRRYKLKSSPVKQLSEKHNLPIFQPASFRTIEEQKLIITLKSDIMIVVDYGIILPEIILSLPRLGCINIHGSLLPRWRGAAPVQRALLAGDNQTGVTIIQMDAGIDTGAILNQVTCSIEPCDTTASLYEKLAKVGSDALLFTLKQLAAGRAIANPQNDLLAVYADKLRKNEARLNWCLPAIQLERNIRAFNPWPVSYFLLSKQIIKVWASTLSTLQIVPYKPGTIIATDKAGIHVATGNGILTLTALQPAGKKVMLIKDFLNSRNKLFVPGTLLE